MSLCFLHFREEYWDQFQSIAEDPESSSSYGQAVKVATQALKVVLYVVLFLLILGGMLTARIALFAMSSSVGRYENLVLNLTRPVESGENGTTTTSNPSPVSLLYYLMDS